MRHCTIVVYKVVLFHENGLFCFISYLKKKTYCDMFFFSLRENLCYEMDKTNISMFEILEPGGQLWANTAFRGLNSIELGYLNFTTRLT